MWQFRLLFDFIAYAMSANGRFSYVVARSSNYLVLRVLPTVRALTQLPKRLGGLGLLSNEAMKPLAASNTLSYASSSTKDAQIPHAQPH